ncbi:flagellar motor switch protein FliN/FliY [Selenomonas ruminantium]|uniref:Flagellar motor switch protein FliN/FliY n=1 Tax=Selenomonas ruminantium TaxID=971 RepID=A0A1I3F4U9_SELRU|nr:flagellar motor switch phosphatase FliY [Selenomonas ruminantium]SFI06238.1 flagellar motor switch protein FliN/FliY [Selenomonas ruminantium]
MSDDMISQEEIDALLNGGAIPEAGGDAAPAGESEAAAEAPAADSSSSQFDDVLTDMEKDALGEIGNISMGSAATTLSVLLGHKVSITTPTVSVATMSIIQEQYPMPYLIVEVGYTIGIDGNNVLAIQAQDASIIADLMMGGDGTNPDTEINEIAMSAVGESMNQMMGTVATSLSTMFNKKIDISPPKVNLIDLGNEDKVTEIVGQDEPVVRTSFRMEVDGLIDSEIMQILPVPVAKEMVEALTNSSKAEEPEPAPAPAAAPAPAPAPTPAPAPAAAPPPQAAPAMAAPAGGYGMAMQPHVATNVPVQSAQFTPLNTQPVQVNDANIGLILDVPLQVTVELGRTKKSIKEILELTNGSIVELDKLAGEPVDIQVNGKFLAKGEVVVIDENFGVRITEIASPAERAAKLQ